MGAPKIIVGVHGIGDQVRNETIRAIVRQFCKYYEVPGAVPLGRYHIAPEPGPERTPPGIFMPLKPPDPQFPELFGFAEVYWADIPRRIVRRGYTLEEEISWAHSIVERFKVRYAPENRDRNRPTTQPSLSETNFDAIKAVLGEMIESLKVMESLTFLADKAGLFKFDLKKLLDDFIGDVQVVTEFNQYRKQILTRFREVMREIHRKHSDAEIHIIAHSEGTVVAFLSLLEALGAENDPRDWEWLQQVRGLMTIGSPIDKHIILWPQLWEELTEKGLRSLPAGTIKWRNYYDFGDPVGFQLDTARFWLETNKVAGFEFVKNDRVCHDFGFSRYPLPGKAHVDYWDDEQVFGHFISHVVDGGPDVRITGGTSLPSNPPENKLWASFTSKFVSYLLVALLIFAAVFVLDKALADCLNAALPKNLPAGKSPLEMLANVAGLSLLLTGLTVASRIPRLIRRTRFYVLALTIFVPSAFFSQMIASRAFEKLGAPICNLMNILFGTQPGCANPSTPAAALLAACCGILLLSWVVNPAWGKRTLLLSGSAVALLLVLALIFGSAGHGPLWPVIVAGAFFFYLWWLAILLFDLVFIWRYYIRKSNALKKMHALYCERTQ